jgi:hypothetical protein
MEIDLAVAVGVVLREEGVDLFLCHIGAAHVFEQALELTSLN